MNVIFNFLNSPSGYTLGYAGIAITYLVTFIIAMVTEEKTSVKVASLCATVIFFILTLRVASDGVIKSIIIGGVTHQLDAGQPLAYLGIGAGLICTGWTAHLKKHIWMEDIIVLFGFLFVSSALAMSMEPDYTIWALAIVGASWIIFDLVKKIMADNKTKSIKT